jgi:hypothetical protein
MIKIMKKALRIRISALALVGLLFCAAPLWLAPPVQALTANQQQVCEAIGSDKDCTKTEGTDINSTIATVLNLFSTLIGVVAVLMIMYAGFKYTTAAGDSSKIASAKNTLIYAVIGLIVAALAKVIVRFTIHQAAQ